MKTDLSRRLFLKRGAVAAGAASSIAIGSSLTAAESPRVPKAQDTFSMLKKGKKIPVIFDTDIGNDIDDTWALTLLLKSPELDVKLVTSDSGNDIYRAKIIAKMLEVAGRTDIPVGIGHGKTDIEGRQSKWVGDYDLSKYPGTIHEDGVGAIIKTIKRSPDPISLVCVGPVPNIGLALDRDPGIARRARFVGMHGSVRRGYGGSRKISAEYNVRADPKALQKVFAAPWDITITPLDTCGIIRLTGQKYQKVYRCKDPLVQALMANYRVWSKNRGDPTKASSVLFDTVAIYLALTEELVEMEKLPIRVTDDGRTVIDEKARVANCAMKWKDLDAFYDFLVERLTAS
ncbi:MAG: nucleoside hydrolase [Planctomycetota bacterium]|jgi:inosine-uridine nucleoside N-ribohydrolase